MKSCRNPTLPLR